MSPRPYNLDGRKAAAQETRARIIEAARTLLESPDGIVAFTLDAVAKQAGVARMTVYYQFNSKLGLLDALYDALAHRGLMPRLPAVMQQPDPEQAVLALVDTFTAFWQTDQLATRRLRALARLDPEVEQGITERDGWRRQHLHNLLARLEVARGDEIKLSPETEDLVYSLTSFEFYDTLSSLNADAAAIIRGHVARLLQIADQPPETGAPAARRATKRASRNPRRPGPDAE
jgi:AcrR family transcriptional regulator